jgi:PPM family protein phosphatase
MVVDLAGQSHIGLKRKENQDSFLAERKGELVCIAVADGMGGHEEGRRASETAISSLRTGVAGLKPGESAYEAFCLDLERSAHESVSKLSTGNQIVGTTLTLALIDGDDCYIGHVGDSRVYRFHDTALDQLTEDHTWEEFSRRHNVENPHGNALRQAIGVGEAIEPEVHHLKLVPGDWILVCSDGLYKMVDNAGILRVFQHAKFAELVCRDLVQRALEAGGKDNVAVCVLRVGQPGERPVVPKTLPTPKDYSWLVILAIAIVIGYMVWKLTTD